MPENKPSYFDKLRAKADEMHLMDKVEEFADQADKLTRQAAGKVGEMTHENRDKVDGFLDKAASTVDEQTGGKYADKVAKARASASKGVDKVAGHRAQAGHPEPEDAAAAADPAAPDAGPAAPAGQATTSEAEPSVPEAPDEPMPPTGGPTTHV